MILIYTNKITPRVRYIFKHIFTRILKIEIDFTTKVEEFVAFNGAKMSYSKLPLGSEFFVRSQDLLFQQGVDLVEINIRNWEETPCFFETGKKSAIPYDIFAASFYLITRYEEYLPHIKDSKKRFKSKHSIAYLNNFLEKPVIDIWAQKLLLELKKRFPNFKFKKREYSVTSTINVNEAFLYENKGISGLWYFTKDLFNLKIYKVIHRLAVAFTKKKDPYNTFEKILKLQNHYNVKTMVFFIAKKRNVSRTKFQLLVKNIADYTFVGLQPSIKSVDNELILKHEKEQLEEITHIPLQFSRQHESYFLLPKTYQNLIDLEITEDYSMGYTDIVGFRASTCTPFYFYDMDFEIQTPLKIFPYTFSDQALHNMKLTAKQAIGKIRDLKKEVEDVNGNLISIFHNDTISGYSSKWRDWKNVYENMLIAITTKKTIRQKTITKLN